MIHPYAMVQADGVNKSLQLIWTCALAVLAVAGTICRLLTVPQCPNWPHQSALTCAMEVAGTDFATVATSAAFANLDLLVSFAKLMSVHLHDVVSMAIAQLATSVASYRS